MSRRRMLIVGAAVVLLLGLGVGYWRWYLPTRAAVEIGAGMLAKQICSCVYIANRDVEACRADMLPALDPIRMEVQRAAARVRAWVPGLGERTALYRAGLGCTLE